MTTPEEPQGKLTRGCLFAMRFVVANVFIVLGAQKIFIADAGEVLKVWHLFNMFPEPEVLNYAVVVLPWFEFIIGNCLLLGIRVRAAAFAAAVMLILFTVAILFRAWDVPEYASGAISFSEIELDCGCGTGEVIVWQKMMWNLIFAALVIPSAIRLKRRKKPSPQITRATPRPVAEPPAERVHHVQVQQLTSPPTAKQLAETPPRPERQAAEPPREPPAPPLA